MVFIQMIQLIGTWSESPEGEAEEEKEEESTEDLNFDPPLLLLFAKIAVRGRVELPSAILYGLKLFPIVSYLFSVVEHELRDTTEDGRQMSLARLDF